MILFSERVVNTCGQLNAKARDSLIRIEKRAEAERSRFVLAAAKPRQPAALEEPAKTPKLLSSSGPSGAGRNHYYFSSLRGFQDSTRA